MEKCLVFLDGEYLNKIRQHFVGSRKIGIDRFAVSLAKREDLWCEHSFYYTAPPYQSPRPTPEEMRRTAGYDKFIHAMRQIPQFTVREGRCQKTDDGFRQKGVDTLITTDLIVEASKGLIKSFVILTSDTDFVPVLKRIHDEYKVKVILYYFNDYVRGSRFAMSNHLLTACDKCILLTNDCFDSENLI